MGLTILFWTIPNRCPTCWHDNTSWQGWVEFGLLDFDHDRAHDHKKWEPPRNENRQETRTAEYARRIEPLKDDMLLVRHYNRPTDTTHISMMVQLVSRTYTIISNLQQNTPRNPYQLEFWMLGDPMEPRTQGRPELMGCSRNILHSIIS